MPSDTDIECHCLDFRSEFLRGGEGSGGRVDRPMKRSQSLSGVSGAKAQMSSLMAAGS